MDLGLKNKVIVITGGGAGIGEAVNLRAARCGPEVIFAIENLVLLAEAF
jgi:NAD(P)-dependent dehydrogenase (short-subunit alcohol dehydrogenase family)